jgi:hypothetical protein
MPVSWSRRPAAASISAASVVVAGLVVTGLAGSAPAAGRAPGHTAQVTAPAFLVPTSARGEALPRPRAVAGRSSLVTLRTSLLPKQAEGQPVRFDLGRQSVTGRFTRIEHNKAFTAWTGSLDVDLGTFTIVRAGDTYRASILWPQGQFEVTQAEGSRYWLTAVAPYAGPSGRDTISPAPSRASKLRPAPRVAERRRTRVDVLFAYTSDAKAAAGSKAAIKAAVGQAAATTNIALANSGLKVEIRVKGIVKVKGKASKSVFKDLKRLERPHDGTFDSAIKARAKHHADIVHLLTGGPADRLCGAGALPRTKREVSPLAGASTSYLSCLPYIVATHELGHNLGADHISYPGVSHDSRLRGAYGWYDVPHHFLTTMGYYDPCEDVGDYTCVRIPWFSNPHGNFLGAAIGSRAANNAKVIKRIAPMVARYSR